MCSAFSNLFSLAWLVLTQEEIVKLTFRHAVLRKHLIVQLVKNLFHIIENKANGSPDSMKIAHFQKNASLILYFFFNSICMSGSHALCNHLPALPYTIPKTVLAHSLQHQHQYGQVNPAIVTPN